jgi:hypothetical protein
MYGDYQCPSRFSGNAFHVTRAPLNGQPKLSGKRFEPPAAGEGNHDPGLQLIDFSSQQGRSESPLNFQEAAAGIPASPRRHFR